MPRKLLNAIRFWFSHSTALWVAVDKLNNVILQDSFAIFDKVLSTNEIASLYTAAVSINDKDWHHIVFVFRRFGKQGLYIDGNQVTNDFFK